MAPGIVLSFQPTGIRAYAAGPGGAAERGQHPRRGGGSWWAPIFGWGAEADYIEGPVAEEDRPAVPRRKFAGLTEEKARELRMRTMEMESFQDAMYHSAIASRLASDRPRRHSSST